MRTLKLTLPAAILAAGFLVCNVSSYGKPAYATKEKKGCTFCHEKMLTGPAMKDMKDNLIEAGKYYAAHDHSLDGYKGK
jgi:cytochrome c551/c552